MKTLITDQRERVSAWVAEQIGGGSVWSGEYSAIGQEQNGQLIAGVIFDGWVPGARCTMHCAGIGRTWLNRKFLSLVFLYAFIQLQCKVIINTVASTNSDSIKFTEHIGFTELFRIPDADPAGDLIVYALRKEDCRWINLIVR